MKFQHLLRQSKARFGNASNPFPVLLSTTVFRAGAHWMFCQLPTEKRSANFNAAIPYTLYGIGKYGISLLAFAVSALLLCRVSLLLLPLSIVVFYLIEVHFLFLFPLLLDGVEQPLLKSIQQTYRIGLFPALVTVVPIGFYMLAGVCHFKNPLRAWHIGCGAILIWYQHEVRDWV